ncbi:MAG: Rieske (2Fe-2S) protein [Candidatus Eisenbacteria bacterium]|nr:Rieske (2Fe-2S) protein [Candidatus Eisenbacteria bacterium]
MSAPRERAAPATGEPATRRRFLTWLSRAFLGLWGLGAAGVVGAYLRAPEHREKVAGHLVSAGLLDDFKIGEGRLVRHGVSPFYVVRLDAERVVALSAVCTHVRCIVDFDRERRVLVCPCHDGRFDLAGNVLSGPPPRALPTYAVSVRAGEIFVHL